MSRYAILLLLPLLLFPLASCGGEAVYAPAPLMIQSEAVARQDEIVPLDLQIEIENHALGMYEPAVGGFIGAYIKRDATARGIRAFEADTGVNHAIFAYTMTLGGEYPLRWVLENIAGSKMPFIIVMPPEAGDVYDMGLLAEFARETGRFDVPVFVNLFPVVEGHRFVPTEYIAFFREARGVFAEYAPNVALVWGFDAQSMVFSTQFYPGRGAADWIHLIIYNEVDTSGGFRDF
ncbi:MAG: hypothetical protein LBE55_05970, partial [Clostridiales bacterium]|nr:hypothetical protein [Clostridiales bacterium]